MSVIGGGRPAHVPHLPPGRSSSSSLPRPKGILKNARDSSHPQTGQQHNLQWDEENLALTEINKDSLMKITEPKTPYVRYNALTDEIEGDIPDLSLSAGFNSQHFGEEHTSPEATHATLADDPASPSSRRTSISASPGRPRAGSGTSSRSTSFNLPNEARKDIRLEDTLGAEEVEVDEEEMDEETAAKHAAFVRARKGHYSNEAEAMKRAAQLMEEEEDDVSGSNAPSDVNDDDSMFGDEEDGEEKRTIPPVPPLPTHINGKNAGPSSSNQ